MREQRIKNIINNSFSPTYFEIVNESDMHQGPPNRETHFKLVIVSDNFIDSSRVQRHQAVYKLLQAELNDGLHALALKIYTASEWQKVAQEANLSSPECAHKK